MRAADIAPTIKALRESGATSLRAIADGLNAQGIPTARGSGEWSPTQVVRVLERLCARRDPAGCKIRHTSPEPSAASKSADVHPLDGYVPLISRSVLARSSSASCSSFTILTKSSSVFRSAESVDGSPPASATCVSATGPRQKPASP